MSEITAPRQPWVDWPMWDLRVLEAADARAVAVAALAGVAVDVGVRSGVATVGGWLATAIVGTGLLASRRLRTTVSRACVLVAIALAGFLLVRTSAWLVSLDVLAVAGLLALAGMLARDGRATDLPARLLASRAVIAVGHGLTSAAFLVEPARRWFAGRAVDTGRLRPLASGVALALPIVAVLGALLASADVVFASALRLRLPVPDDLAGHAVLVVVGALAVGGVLRTASSSPSVAMPGVTWRLGTIEWTVVLSSVVVLFTAFAAAQLVTLGGGARHVLETEGLTYAEYARTGYVQLLAVAALTGLVLAGVGAVAARPTPAARRRFTVLAELTVALTAVVLVVALRRLGLYEDAYGWTMLRLMAKAGAVWLGVVLLLLAARLGGAARDRDWFLPAAIVVGVVTVAALNVVNPEAAVARHNLHDARHELDPVYLSTLSDDAVPTIVDALPMLPEARRMQVVAAVCSSDAAESGALSWNHAAQRAAAARARVCPR